jgi:signal transduction histidine kinase
MVKNVNVNKVQKISFLVRLLTILYFILVDWVIFGWTEIYGWQRIVYLGGALLFVAVSFLVYKRIDKKNHPKQEEFTFYMFMVDLAFLLSGIFLYGFSIVRVIVMLSMFLYAGYLFSAEKLNQFLIVGFVEYYIGMILANIFWPEKLLLYDNFYVTVFVYLGFAPLYMVGFFMLVRYTKDQVILRDEILAEQARLKTDFLATSAHQLRTPLAGINWTNQMLLEGDLGPVSNKQIEYLLKSQRGVKQMLGKIEDMLTTVKVEDGSIEYHFEEVAMVPLIKEAVENHKPNLEQKQLQVRLTGNQLDPMKAVVDKQQIAYVIDNYLSNAVKYTPIGKTITVGWDKNDKYFLYWVQDQGIGIPKADQKNIFSKFFRATNAPNVETGSSGIGLFITKTIVTDHGGKVWFESEEGKGSTFYMQIPLRQVRADTNQTVINVNKDHV